MGAARALAVALAAAAVAIVVAFQLTPYTGRDRPGVSFDTPYYVWRTRLVAAEGTGPLLELPEAVTTNPDRPGFPVLGAVVDAVTGTDAFTFAIVVRAVAAVAIGLAAGAIGLAVLGHPPWALGVYVAALGVSAAVTGTAIGSLENLLVDVPLMAIAGTVPLALHGRRAAAAVALLFAGAALIHWVFAALFLMLLVAVGIVGWAIALALDPDGSRIRGRSVFVVIAASIGGVAVAAAVLPALPEALPPTSGNRGNLLRLGIYELPLLLPLAVVGAVLSFRRAAPVARTGTLLLALWATSVPVAMGLSGLLPEPLKIFRIAAFALGVPTLAAAGLVAIVLLARERHAVVATGAAVALLVAGLAMATAPDAGPFNDRSAAHIANRLQEARTAGRYLAGATARGPVVVVVDGKVGTVDRVVRSAVPANLIADTHVYVGRSEDLLRGRPTVDPARPRLSAESAEWWGRAWPDPTDVLRRDPVVIGLASTRAEEGVSLDEGVRVIRGPAPPASFAPPAPIHLAWPRAIATVVLVLGLLGVVGLGWGRSLVEVGWAPSLGLAPAFGVAALVVLGCGAARLGLPLGGATGIGLAVLGTVAGWIPWLLRRRWADGRGSAS